MDVFDHIQAKNSKHIHLGMILPWPLENINVILGNGWLIYLINYLKTDTTSKYPALLLQNIAKHPESHHAIFECTKFIVRKTSKR